jgi:polyhydroxybutyrate depolymerase
MLIVFFSCSTTLAEDTAFEKVNSLGCGKEPIHTLGGEQVTISLGTEAGDTRSFYLSIPTDYNPDLPYSLLFGFSGTDWVGEQIQGYFELEQHAQQTIFIYPDPLWRDFEGWGNYGGWLLGEYAHPAHGTEDLVFVEELLDTLSNQYCIDSDKVFATGHSWGGDMAQVVSCFLGDRFTATVPVAANRPYWFEDTQGNQISCIGDTAVWTLFGEADDHFTWQSYPGEFGEECRDFWVAEKKCTEEVTEFILGSDTCYEYVSCDNTVRYCLYDEQYGHQIPWNYFSQATMEWFMSF